MEDYREILFYILGFIWILFASDYLAKYFQKIRLPLITGFIVTGIIAGPQVLDLIRADGLQKLDFINDVSLAFIALAAGAELYLKEIRHRVRSIMWNTFGQLVVTFVLSATAVYFIADLIPFMKEMTMGAKIGVAILAGTIFVARSPSSAIAVISEMRAKGPFTQTAISVTVLKDVLVIVLFSICFSLARNLVLDIRFDFVAFAILLLELGLAFGAGYLLGRLVSFFLALHTINWIKTILILAAGYGIFLLSHLLAYGSSSYAGYEVHVEPLLVCIGASFWVTNYTNHRPEFRKLLHETGPYIYVAFFTLTGAMMSFEVLSKVWAVALLLFVVRLVSMMVGAYLGSTFANDPALFKKIGWMPYVTQAGVSLGLATEVAGEFPGWGVEFATIIIAVIVLNQFVGPPLFKWAINRVGESHLPADTGAFGAVRFALIIGLEDQSLALARQLQRHDWVVKVASFKKKEDVDIPHDVDLQFISNHSVETLQSLNAQKADAIVLMVSDTQNYAICELIYEHFGTKEIIVRLHDRVNFSRFHKLGAMVVEPSSAMVGLLDHFVRSPIATSFLLGMEENQDTMDIEILDRTMHGVALRDLRLPSDIIILSVKRRGQLIISHGYTRLRFGDLVTAAGAADSLEQLRHKLEG